MQSQQLKNGQQTTGT